MLLRAILVGRDKGTEGDGKGEGDEEGWNWNGGVSEEALRRYQEEMREYAVEAIWISHKGGKTFFDIREMEELEVLEH